MTWIHCSIKDGSCIALTYDEEFDEDNVSEAMEKHFVHIHVDKPLKDLVHLTQPVMDDKDSTDIKHKFKGKINLEDTEIIPSKDLANIKDENIRMKPIKTVVSLTKITERLVSKASVEAK